MHILENLNYMLEDMIEPIVKKGDISPTELDNIYKAVKTIYYGETIKAMKEYGSNDGSYDSSYYSYAGGRGGSSRNMSYRTSYDGRMGMDGDSDGRYSERRNSRGRYSRAEEKEVMMEKLERKLENASSEPERQTIRDCMRIIEER